MFPNRWISVCVCLLAANLASTSQPTAIAAEDEASAAQQAVPATTIRVWKDSTGQFTLEAQYAGVADGQVRLRCADGRTISVPLEKLSSSDQEHIRRTQRTDGTADRAVEPVSSESMAKTLNAGKPTEEQRIAVLRVPAMRYLDRQMGMLQSAIADELARRWPTMGQEEIARTLQEHRDLRLGDTIRLVTGSSRPVPNESDELAKLAAVFGARVIVRGTLQGDSKAATVRLSVRDLRQRKVVATVNLPADPRADLRPLVDAIARIWPPSTEEIELAPGGAPTESTGQRHPGDKHGSAGASPVQAVASDLLVLPVNLSGAARTVQELRQLDHKHLQEAGQALEARIVKELGNRWSIVRPEEVWRTVTDLRDRALRNSIQAAMGRSRTKGTESDMAKLAATLGGRIVICSEAQNTSGSVKIRISAWDSRERREIAAIDCPIEQQVVLSPLVTALNGVLSPSATPQVAVFSLGFNTDMETSEKGRNLSLAIRDALSKAGVRAVFLDEDPPTVSYSTHGAPGAPGAMRDARFFVSGAGVHRERAFHSTITRFDIKFQDARTGRGERVAKNVLDIMNRTGPSAAIPIPSENRNSLMPSPPAAYGPPAHPQRTALPDRPSVSGEKTPPPAPVALETHTNSIGMPLVLIPAGEFVMGFAAGESDEIPAHRVRITKPFWMDRYEVTVGQFRCFVEDAKYDAGTGWQDPRTSPTDDYPVVRVSWNNAKAFCDWLTSKEGQEYRLPTEAEWEYACRARTHTKWSFGDNERDLQACAWFSGNAGHRTHAVGQKQPNAWGLYDMHGNVWEWCADWYDAS